MRGIGEVRASERAWRARWDGARVFAAPDRPSGPKFFNYASGPFTNGALHLGHVRTYALGDMTARYQRLLGRCVLHATDFDAFGLPNELAADERGRSPAEHTAECLARAKEDLGALGTSYDDVRIPTTSDPAYYRWTQWLFLRFLEWGLVERREAAAGFCPGCRTSLSRMQIEGKACARCGSAVVSRVRPQWFVRIEPYSGRMRAGLDRLSGFSERAKSLLRAYAAGEGDAGERRRSTSRRRLWLVSRERAWGTPISIVHCPACGAVPVPDRDLPVRAPAAESAGERRSGCAATPCPACGRDSRRETDTLDVFFDGIWCSLACVGPRDGGNPFVADRLAAWMPVDVFHSGLDTFVDLHLRRFLGAVLFERGILAGPEPIASHFGHEMVLFRGRKMSKHLGNAVEARALVEAHGADAVRVGILWAAGPERGFTFRPDVIEKAAAFLHIAHATAARAAPAMRRRRTAFEPRSRAASRLAARSAAAARDVARFIEDYRPNAAIDVLADLSRRACAFVDTRIGSGRLRASDAAALEEALARFAVALSPFAPFLAEEVWALLGRRTLVAAERWPTPLPVGT